MESGTPGRIGPAQGPSDERRRHGRTRFEGWVELAVDGVSRRVSACDLSGHGIGLALDLDSPLPGPQTAVASEFALPGIRLPLALDGVVAWVDPDRGRLGIHFVDVDPALTELLENYVQGRL